MTETDSADPVEGHDELAPESLWMRIYRDPRFGAVLECNDYELFDAITDYLTEAFDDSDDMTAAFSDNLYIIYPGHDIDVEELERRVEMLKMIDQYVASAQTRQPLSPKPDCV